MNTTTADTSVEITDSNNETVTPSVVYFSPMIALRIMNGDSIMDNEFIAESIGSADSKSISYEDDHIMLMVDHTELSHFLHLAYQYSEKHLVVVLDGTFDYEATMEGEIKEKSFTAQLMTITESHINK